MLGRTKPMDKRFVLTAPIAVSIILVPIGFRFSPHPRYLMVCLAASLVALRPLYRHLLHYWNARVEARRANGIKPWNVLAQAIALSACVFFLSCFVIGIFFTKALGTTSLEHGKVISSWPSRRCTNLTVRTETAGFVGLCTKYPVGVGSFATVRVRHSVLGHYVE